MLQLKFQFEKYVFLSSWSVKMMRTCEMKVNERGLKIDLPEDESR